MRFLCQVSVVCKYGGQESQLSRSGLRHWNRVILSHKWCRTLIFFGRNESLLKIILEAFETILLNKGSASWLAPKFLCYSVDYISNLYGFGIGKINTKTGVYEHFFIFKVCTFRVVPVLVKPAMNVLGTSVTSSWRSVSPCAFKWNIVWTLGTVVPPALASDISGAFNRKAGLMDTNMVLAIAALSAPASMPLWIIRLSSNVRCFPEFELKYIAITYLSTGDSGAYIVKVG